jgi:hypothetical protein
MSHIAQSSVTRHSGNDRHKLREWRVTQDSNDVADIAQSCMTRHAGTVRNKLLE